MALDLTYDPNLGGDSSGVDLTYDPNFKPKKTGAIRGIADLGLGFVSGAVGATKALADAAGAGSGISSALNDANEGITGYLSDSAKADQLEQSRIMQEAEGKGTWEGIKAGAKAFGVAPLQTAVSGLGSVVPVVAGAAATALTGGGAPAALAAGAGIGATMGAGTVKGAIFDEVKKRGIESGMSEADAIAEATKAQEYGGDNTGNIAVGAGLGMADAATGVTKAASNIVRNAIVKPAVTEAVKTGGRGIVGRTVAGIAGEMPLEAAQGGQERYSANVAAQRAGYDADPWAGVASQATLEALASAGPGAAFGAFSGSKYVESKTQPPAEEQQPISGLLPAPTYTGTPGDQLIANDAERQAAIDAADANAAALYAAREAFENQLRQSVTIINEPAPLQQRIDDMLSVDSAAMSKDERADYEKSLAAAFSEQIGVRHDENQREVPFTMGEYLDAQVAAEDAVRARPLKQWASRQADARLQQIADEETAGYVAPDIPVIGTLSAAANLAVKSGAHAAIVAQQQAAIQNSQAEASITKTGKADTPTTGNREAAPQTGILAGIAAQAPSIAIPAPNTQPQGEGGTPAAAQQAGPAVASPAGFKAQATTGNFDVSNRTDTQLNYLTQHGQPGWKEAAVAELQKRGVQVSDAQQAKSGTLSANKPANSATVPAQKAADSAKPSMPVEVNADEDENAPTYGGKYDQVFKGKVPNGYRLVGKNPDGKNVFEAGGIRVVEDGEYFVRELSNKPPQQRYAEFKTADEVAKLRANVAPTNEGDTKQATETKAEKPLKSPTDGGPEDSIGWTRMTTAERTRLLIGAGYAGRGKQVLNLGGAGALNRAWENMGKGIREKLIAAHDAQFKTADQNRINNQSGDSTEMVGSVSQPKADAAPEAAQDKAPVSKPKARNKIEPEKDSLFVAIAKAGGMDTDELLNNGFDSNDITFESAARVKKDGQLSKKRRMPISFGFALPLHKKGGMSFDAMREAMQQYGYLPEGATKNDAIDLFRQELGGDPVYTAKAIELRQEQDQEAFDKMMQEEQDRIDAELAAQEIAEADSGYFDLSEQGQDVFDDFAELAFGENGKQDDNAIRAGMRALGFTEEEINDELAKNSQAQRESEEIAAGGSQEGGAGRDGNGAQDAQARERRGEEGFDLTGQTNDQAAEQFAQQQAGESDAPTKEQADRERDAVPFSMQMQSQPKPQGVQTGLFTADGRVAKDADQAQSAQKESAAELSKPAEDGNPANKADGAEENSRDRFTLNRLNRDTNTMEPVTFERGEYVRYLLSGASEAFGEIDGISQARREFSVDGLWYPFGAAYKAERPAEARPATVPLSSVIDSVNTVNGDGLSEADRIATVESHSGFMERLNDGDVTIDEFKARFESVKKSQSALVAELGKKTKAELLGLLGWFRADRMKNEKKDRIVDSVYRSMLDDFVLGDSISYGFGSKYEDVIGGYVGRYAQSDIDAYAEKIKANRAEREQRREAVSKAIADPQTLEDFRRLMQAKVDGGKALDAARLELTPEQRARFDTLLAEESRGRRASAAESSKTEVRAAAQTTSGDIIETKHTKTGEDLFVVKAAERVDRDVYNEWNANAKRLGGWYSSFRGNGAVPGFQFKSRENAAAFLQYLGGDTTAAKEAIAERRDAFADDRSQSAVERLNEMADRLEERADESLGRERKANTARRARFAASAEAAANSDKALARTMRNIADAIAAGTTKFLDRVRQKAQVEMLRSTVRTAQYSELQKKYPSYVEQEKHRGEKPTAETADYARWPTFTADRADLARLGRDLLQIDGAKLLGQRILKVADDVTDAYQKFAKENLHKVSVFSATRAGSDEKQMAVFPTADRAEAAIARSGYKGKATTISFKRGEYLVIMGPEMAREAGLWQGDPDKRITLKADVGEEIVAKVKSLGKGKVSMPHVFESVAADRARWKALGIETAAEQRATLREFIALQEAPAAPDRIKQLERAMVGRANDGLDFFPTPAETAKAMIDAADIQEGMAVLEPSAGMGHIAEQIRDVSGVDPDVVEFSTDRRELLEAKGFHVVGNDFMDLSPRGFTYGDVFRDKDGVEGIMRGSGGMGSNRVGFIPLGKDERQKEWRDRDELEGVRKNGINSGYDRIVMNPPFSNRRDAEHVQHAYSLLKPGGRLVAIMGEGVFYGQDKKAQAFRDWLETVGGTSEKLEEGTFLDPSLPVNTSVNARMVVVDKPAGEAAPVDNEGTGNVAGRNDSLSPADTAIYGMVSEGRRAEDILKFIASASRNPMNRQLAKLLLKTGIAPQVMASTADGWKFNAGNDKKYAAAYNQGTNTIALFRPAAAERNFLHEAMHAATLRALSKKGMAAAQMKALFDHVKKSGGLKGMYGMSDVDEFVAEAFSNPKFQDALKTIAAPKTSNSTLSSAWQWFVRIVRGILGIPQGQDNALSQAIEIGLGVMREDMALRNPRGALDYATASTLERKNALMTMPATRIDDPSLNGMDKTAIRAEVSRRFRGFKATPATTLDGREVKFTAPGLREIKSHSADIRTMLLANKAPELMAKAIPLFSLPHQRKNAMDSVRNWHYYGVKVDFGGKTFFARIVAREAVNGAIHYDNDLSTVEEVNGRAVQTARQNVEHAAPTKTGASAVSADRHSLVKWLSGIKPERIKYNVVDDQWSVSEPSKMDEVIYALQDKHIDTKRVVQAIMGAGRKIKDAFNPYLQEELFHGRAAKGVKDFLDFELRPLLKEMQDANVDMGDFEEYLWNRHAEERNRQIAKINPDMPDAGSGIATADAKAYLAGLSAEQKRTFESLAKKVEVINQNSQRVLVESGLEKQSTIDAWNGAYKHYVPLQREDVDSGHTGGTGKGFSVRGSSTKRAMGSGKTVVDIIANLTMQRERNIVRAEKNRVSNALLGLAVQNPNPDFWKVDQAPKERVVEETAIYTVRDEAGKKLEEFTRMDDAERFARNHPGSDIEQTWGDRVKERVTPGFTSRDNVLLTRINGDDHYIIFNERDERAMRMVTAMKNLDVDNLGRVLSVVGKATRYLSSINTQYNPVFGVINLIRDAQGALINLSSTPLAGEQKRVLGYTKDALVGIYRDIRAHRAGKVPSSNWAALFEEFQKEGGQTGYRDQYANAEARAEAIQSELKQFSEGKAKQFTRGIFGWLSDYNETMENAVRLAAYKAAKEKGMSNQRAASLAKNITVNFNRKGQMATQVGALYAFFNASVQGTARIAETLFEQRGGDLKSVRLSKVGKKIVAGGIMLGSMQAMLLAAAGFDDDEPPEFIRERNLILPIGDGKYLTLAMPLGFHVIPGIGRIATEFVMGGGKDPIKHMAAFAGMFAESFNPIGSSGFSLQTITPSVVDPFAALAENRDFTGKEIYRKDFNALNPTPGHMRAKDVATFYSRWISEGLNFITGGTEFKPGLISWSPDSIDYLVAQAGGGVMREANKVLQTGGAAITGEDLPLYKIPLVGRFIGDTEGQSGQSAKFYDAIKKINMHEAEYKGLLKDGRRQEAMDYLAENPAVKLIMAGNRVESQVRKLRSMKRDMVEKDADPDQVRAIDERITATMKAFNERSATAF